MRFALRLAACVTSAIVLMGCASLFRAHVAVTKTDAAPPFTQPEQERAKAIVVEIGRAAGFWETDTAAKLSDRESSWPYVAFVSLGAPGGDPDRQRVHILAEMRKDRRELRVLVGDDARGDPLPSTRQLVDELRTALERAFPDSRVEAASRKARQGFGP